MCPDVRGLQGYSEAILSKGGALRVGQRLKESPLPEGTVAVGGGLMVAGLTAYVFLVLTARALGPERYASLSALWALVYLIGPGFFFPIEQEVGRALAARNARGEGAGPLVRRAGVAGASLAGALVIACLITSALLLERLFDGEVFLLVGLTIGLVAYCAQYLARGILSGNGKFGRYGLVIGSEGFLRLAGCVGLVLMGVYTSGPYGLVIGLAPVLAIAIGMRGQRGLVRPGPGAPWAELSSAIGYLLAGSVLAQLLVNAGPLAVKLLASEAEKVAAGRFLAGLVIARIPLFLFQAVQAALLPRLARFAAAGQHSQFRSALGRLLVTVAVIGAAATVAAFAAGPWVVRLLFGRGFELGRTDLAYLAGASAAYMVAVVLAQALIALSAYARVALGWLAGVVALVLVTAIGSGLLARVEQGFLAGSVVAACAMALLLAPRIAAGDSAAPERLVEASRGVPIEP